MTSQDSNSTPPADCQSIILDSIADGVFTVDEDWRITSFNRAAEAITGVPRDQALGQKCFDVFRADICQGACALRSTIETGKEVVDAHVTILDSEGRRVPVTISTAVLRDEDGHVLGGVETFRDVSALEMLRQEVQGQYTVGDIVTKNHELHQILDILPDIAISESTVLIEGPSGSGKELFAKAIHDLSPRKDKPFVAVNCGALPDTLLESELFGHVRGAFTDAKADRPGRFARAEGGTLFLDEIGDIATALQVKLLRVLQEREYEPVGASAPVKADVRIIAATNRGLAELLANGTFREDLYYRLNVVRVALPSLAQRREDIPLLADHFIRKFNAEKGKHIDGVSDEAMDVLLSHDFPGNVRELENIIEHGFVLCHGDVIEPRHLPRQLVEELQPSQMSGAPVTTATGGLEQAEAAAIEEALRQHDGHRGKAAESLGIHPTTLWRKMKKLGISSS